MKKNMISIVDNDKIYHYLTERFIKSSGYNVDLLPFHTAEDALVYIKSNLNNPDKLPDKIFLDINMPVVNGWDFLNEFVLLKPALPKIIIIYIVSSSVSESDISRAGSYRSISEYLVKPITKIHFLALINKMVA